MWSDIVRIFLTVVLSIAFLVFFGQRNIKRYQEGGIAKIRDEEDMLPKKMPVPGKTFIFSLPKTHKKTQIRIIVVVTLADMSNFPQKTCKGDLDIEGCVENDKRKILQIQDSDSDDISQSFYADYHRKVKSLSNILTFRIMVMTTPLKRRGQ